ncbi:MAG: tetratricopeptide repeat protein [Parafilimonas sp.]
MPDTLKYIEAYFKQTLTSEEKSEFEKRCTTDETFAKDVAFYIAARQSLHEKLLAQKQAQWKEEDYTEETTPVISIAKKSIFSRYITYAAAACLLLAASVYFFEANKSPRILAFDYIKGNFSTLSQHMSGDRDSLTLGIAAYNNKEYDKALLLFEGVEQRDDSNDDAKKYAGLAYLQQKNYDKAIEQFDALSKMKLFSNSGDFLKAVALMERNKAGDKEEAKILLKKVVSEKEDHSDEAAEWLKKM